MSGPPARKYFNEPDSRKHTMELAPQLHCALQLCETRLQHLESVLRSTGSHKPFQFAVERTLLMLARDRMVRSGFWERSSLPIFEETPLTWYVEAESRLDTIAPWRLTSTFSRIARRLFFEIPFGFSESVTVEATTIMSKRLSDDTSLMQDYKVRILTRIVDLDKDENKSGFVAVGYELAQRLDTIIRLAKFSEFAIASSFGTNLNVLEHYEDISEPKALLNGATLWFHVVA